MGYAFFSWFPHQAGPSAGMETITLTEDLSDLQVTPKRDVVDSFGIHGGRSRELLRPWVDVRIVLDRFTDRALFRKFTAMINHLERGGVISFCVDSDKAFAARTRSFEAQNATVLELGPQDTDLYTTHPTRLANGDEVVIESGPPAGKREYHTIASHTTDGTGGTVLTVGADGLNLFDDYPAGSVVRYSDLYPALILGPGQVGAPTLVHDHRITYTLDILLSSIQPLPNPDEQGTGGGGAANDWAN